MKNRFYAFILGLSLFIIFLAVNPGQVRAEWTFTPSIAEVYENGYFLIEVDCVSDGSAQTALDIYSKMSGDLQSDIRGATLMTMWLVPGTAAAAPSTTIDLTITNGKNLTLYSTTGASYTAESIHKLYTTIGTYPTVLTAFKWAFNDIGSAGATVYAYILCYR